MATILVGGYYGAGNIGDEAILACIVNELRAQFQNRFELSFIVLSWDPEKTSKEFGVEAIHWKDINGLLDAALRSNLIILGGGGLFFDYWGIDPDTYLRKASWDITAYGSLPLLAKLLDIPCMIYAVGVGPLQTDLARHHTRLAFERCQVATVRDVASRDLLRQIGFSENASNAPLMKVLPDPVFSLTSSLEDEAWVDDLLYQHHIKSGIPLMGINLRYWDFEETMDTWLSSVANGVQIFLRNNRKVQVLLLPFQKKEASSLTNDVQVLKQLADLIDMPERVYLIDDPITPQKMQALIKCCTLMLGMRMHSIVMSINTMTPVIALSYAPKVQSVMQYVGLEEFCNATLILNANDLADQIQKAWVQREEISLKLQSLREELIVKSKEHAHLALNLLSNSKPRTLQFSQEFALDQIRQLYKADETYNDLVFQKDSLQKQVWDLQTQNDDLVFQKDSLQKQVWDLQTQLTNALSQLSEIKSSHFWKVAQRYYHIRDNTPLKYLYHFIVKTRQNTHEMASNMWANGEVAEAIRSIITKLNTRKIKGVFVVTSAFEFDELYNQRVINLSKYLIEQGWGVIYVAWVWHDESEAPPKEVMKNLFQIPSNLFLKSYSALEDLKRAPKYFVVEFPHPDFLTAALKLKNYDFNIIYDIVDEWEEFHKVDQAIWFKRPVEESFVINANYLTAVSQPLIDKFVSLRKDIHLNPNGFTPAILGNHPNIAQRNFKGSKIHLGYFGHLTPSWFDWPFVKEVLDVAHESDLNLQIHLIGYGEPDFKEYLGDFQESLIFHGKIPPGELYKYTQDWDLAMIPFKSGNLSEAVDPIKIYEYLYFGLPVIVKGISHLKDLPNVFVVSNAVQFIEVLNALRENVRDRKQAIDLSEFTWEKRFSKFMEILENDTWMSL